MQRTFGSLAIALAATAAMPAAAAIYETGFEAPDYAPGALQGQQGWTAGSDSIAVSATDALIGDQSLEITRTETSSPLATSAVQTFTEQTGDFWFAFTYNFAGSEGTDFIWAFFSDDADGNNSLGVLFGGDVDARARRGGFNQMTNADGPDLAAGTTHMIVGQLLTSADASGNFATIRLYANPTSATAPATADAEATYNATGTPTDGIGIGAIDTFGITVGGNENQFDIGDVFKFDGFRIGDSYESVIPEPASLALMGLGGLLIAGRRR